jgi:hypothetical protein
MKVFLNKAETILINYAHAFLALIGLMQINKIQFLSNMENVLSIPFIRWEVSDFQLRLLFFRFFPLYLAEELRGLFSLFLQHTGALGY